MDNKFKEDFELETDDVEVDCAIIEPVHPIPPADLSKELPTKDIRLSSIDSGFDSVTSYNSAFDSGLINDFAKLKLGKINETENEDPSSLCDLYDEKVKSNIEEGSKQSVEIQENTENEDLLLEIFKPDKDGDSQLHMAIIQLLAPIALYFINLVPSHHWLNLPNNLLQVPLHLATITRQAMIVRKLMTAGADIVVRDYKGDTPLHIACREGFDDIAGILLMPIQYNETGEIRYEMEQQKVPQDVELMNYNGQSCLHLAAERCHLPILRLLLQNNADINIKDGKCGKTILHYAAETRNSVLLEFLLQQRERIDLNSTTYGGLTAVQLADGRDFSDVVSILRRSGAIYTPLPVEENDSDEEMN
ncbi:NF-kappa-B inhibitor cactus-like [Mytilus californianus]|uniref:NF-kappa-B inhibitor cactus-like n=1 Tax=Mytilus californianus TaxID=6549 RepID=UPI002246A435|nr:NF-kappa-B inhibitor cactus-like [Mytilus californianus]